MSDLDEATRELTARMIESQLRQYMAFWNSPQQVALRERHRREWLARPWYQRVWIRTRSKAYAWRVRLGEIIAGQKFD